MIAKPSRRTLIVLTILLGAMTVASLLLLLLHQRTVRSATMGLVATRHDAAGAELILDTDPSLDQSNWSGISIWLSQTGQDTTNTLHSRHKDLGIGGVASHFVIGNGRGMPDGQIAVTQRWGRQLHGYRVQRGQSPALDKGVVQICLIGQANRPPSDAQMQELIWLVRQLQRHLGIGPDHVALFNPHATADGPWTLSKAWLSRRLYRASPPKLR